eukprot:TRINITY_DN20939_c0_g1_i3.p1 TRINITY_DN20939_c0_g1~~TRINITY_DN20939_c0_g1_i3.p1  ORF type:complete len:499 (+),score=137.31 TRINITY_DN20939_c0_g1_i3:210-1706(+)
MKMAVAEDAPRRPPPNTTRMPAARLPAQVQRARPAPKKPSLLQPEAPQRGGYDVLPVAAEICTAAPGGDAAPARKMAWQEAFEAMSLLVDMDARPRYNSQQKGFVGGLPSKEAGQRLSAAVEELAGGEGSMMPSLDPISVLACCAGLDTERQRAALAEAARATSNGEAPVWPQQRRGGQWVAPRSSARGREAEHAEENIRSPPGSRTLRKSPCSSAPHVLEHRFEGGKIASAAETDARGSNAEPACCKYGCGRPVAADRPLLAKMKVCCRSCGIARGGGVHESSCKQALKKAPAMPPTAATQAAGSTGSTPNGHKSTTTTAAASASPPLTPAAFAFGEVLKVINRALGLAREALHTEGGAVAAAAGETESCGDASDACLQLASASEELQAIPISPELSVSFPKLVLALKGAASTWRSAAQDGLSQAPLGDIDGPSEWKWPEEVFLALAALEHGAAGLAAAAAAGASAGGPPAGKPRMPPATVRKPTPIMEKEQGDKTT